MNSCGLTLAVQLHFKNGTRTRSHSPENQGVSFFSVLATSHVTASFSADNLLHHACTDYYQGAMSCNMSPFHLQKWLRY